MRALALFALISCHVDPVAPPAPASPVPAPAPTQPAVRRVLTVTPVPAPVGAAQREIQASTTASLAGTPILIGFQPIARTGDRIGGTVFGARTSRSGTDLGLCEGLDYTGIWKSGAGLSMLSHFECQPGAMYLTALEQGPKGELSATSTRPVDVSGIDGGNYFCAGSETSWDTHLAGEEYEGDVRKLEPDGTLSDNFEDYNDMARWWDGKLAEGHPWLYGWMIEVPSTGPAVRRWAMGRFSHESGVVMPDERTVYMTDDTPDAGGFFMFQADTARDLSSGTLYAARWTGAGNDYSVSWVSLGHATDAEVEAVVTRRAAFTDLFDVAAPKGTTCPAGLEFVRVSWGPECLRVRPGMEAPASRLESRRSAALAGATTEFIKTEGMAFSPEDHRLFVAMTRIDKGVTQADPAWDMASQDHLKVDRNVCGGVWALDLGVGPADGPGGAFVAHHAQLLVTGRPEGEACANDGIANPDNLAWIGGTGTLAIAEDSGRHANNMLWFYDVQAARLTRVLTAPTGGEVSGLRWTEDVGGYSYLSVSVQHPFRRDPQAAEDAKHSIAGVLGPFPIARQSEAQSLHP